MASSAGETQATIDERFMIQAVRLSRCHLGLTGTNPSVGTLIVKDNTIIGRGITAIGGRPHAETQALGEAGEGAKGATAYVTLEPCAHHGRTPPCAQALINAGVTRVVSALTDLDDRVSGQGYAMLRDAGIEVVTGVGADDARSVLGHYLARVATKQAQATLKLAVSADGKLGLPDRPQVPITGATARAQSHMMRAEHDAILIGSHTAQLDDPELTCRLPGLEDRSPQRIVLDTHARLPLDSKLVQTARNLPVHVVTSDPASDRAAALASHGVNVIAAAIHDGRVALPELMYDLAALGFTSVLVEGGAAVAKAFLEEDLVRSIALFQGPGKIGSAGVMSPLTPSTVPAAFQLERSLLLGPDRLDLYQRT